MSPRLSLSCLVCIAYAFLTACASYPLIEPTVPRGSEVKYEYEATGITLAADGREISFYLDKPIGETVPLLVVIDGSGCSGQLRPGLKGLFRPPFEGHRPFARLAVEKPGVQAADANVENCSQDFLKHYSMNDRVLDHLRVFQHLSYHADWWNGELYIWGWSDGGDIAAQIVAYYPKVTRALLGAMGGGYSMAEHFTEFWVCPFELEQQKVELCVAEMHSKFRAITDNPTWKKTWSGPDNSYKAWASRLDVRLSNLLRDNTTPILIIHGAEDFDQTPVESARKLVTNLIGAGNESFSYWEVAEMGHTWSSLPEQRRLLLEDAMLHWLLTEEEIRAKIAVAEK
ncbi:MAG: alpha/beta hydrolase [Pseudomonadota bacterium]